ncbi:peptidylprolyl isomerase [Anianabacter salinae]|uniref:peptidylprolyl isomerase n=1 Tax=Anianabacter salinae TaxID=2851023 RepID=UPI00225E6FB9|nr:peptidylprolyl isomerase [Anianabacter salinae]MBV0911566.1 peptidyl-prolyl cis-trans isomerase [Anianabacter salinae]
MAKLGQSKTSKTVVWIILALLIVGLAGFGTSNFGGGTRSLGTVGETPVSIDRYARELNQELRAIQAQTGQPLSFAEAQQFGLDRAVLGRVVSQVAIEDEAARTGISVGDANLREQIVQIPAFQGLNGSFDRQSYEFALQNSGLTVSDFEASLRSEVARTVVQGAVSAGTPAPDAYVDRLFTFAAETRDATWTVLGPGALDEPLPEPTEDALRAYYDANPDAFTRPETREITYAWLTPDMVMDEIAVDEDQIRALYDERIDQYVVPERRLVERLVFGSVEQAEDAKARIDAGEASFDAIVEERGLSLEDVDLGDVAEGDLPGPASGALFGLEAPGVAGPITTNLGPALFRMNGILAPQETPFEDVRDELREELVADRARREVDARMDAIDDELAGGATLEELAQDTSMQLGTIGFTQDSRDDIAAYDAFRTAAVEAEIGDFPEVLPLDDGGIFALRLDAVRAPEVQPFGEVRGAVIDAWEAQATTEALAAQAQALADRLNEGAAFGALGLSSRSQAAIGRQAFLDGTPEGMVPALFEMEPGEARVIEGEGRVALVQLDAVNAPDTGNPDLAQLRERLSQQTAQSLGSDMLDAFTRAVETRAGIQLDQNILNQVNAQFQ